MLTALKRHPFPVAAHFEQVLALSFAFPEKLLAPLVPAPLELDGYHGHGFVTVALVRIRDLRPAIFPACLGQDFFFAGYRIFTRLRTPDGRRLRGLKILRSETDKRRMVISGNLLTHYNYQAVRLSDEPGHLRTRMPGGAPSLDIAYTSDDGADLPAGTPFPDWRTARRFAGPMPFTFDVESPGRVVVVEGRRSGWKPRPLRIDSWKVALFDQPPFRGTTPLLANAFTVEDIPYRWEKGRPLDFNTP